LTMVREETLKRIPETSSFGHGESNPCSLLYSDQSSHILRGGAPYTIMSEIFILLRNSNE
jgi:hypothetical protein